MKKTALLLTGVMLAGSVFSLAGCDFGGGSVGKVSGNFKEEATQEQLAESLSKINMEESFDPAKGFGFAVKANLDFSMSMKAAMDSQTMLEMKSTASGTAEYKLTVALQEGQEIPLVLGAGKASMNVNASAKMPDKDGNLQSNSTSQKASVSAYNDTQYVYLDATMTGDESGTSSMKYAVSDIMEKISGQIFSVGYTAEASGSVGLQYDLSTMLSALQEKGFKVYLDTSSGVKIKISADKDFVKSAVDDADVDLPVDSMEFTSTDFDIYLVFDAEGKFKQLGVDVNVAANYSVKQDNNESSASIKIKGGLSVKTYSGKVTIPEGIAEDTKYQLETM